MKNRHIISYALFILGIVLLLVLGLAGGRWIEGVVLGLVFAIVGVIFYRRNK
jgi:Mn2+/Fe2+ NRAMP family transporter